MTKKSKTRINRDRRGIPPLNKIAHTEIDPDRQVQLVITNDILVNQLVRDGPRVARSFDRIAKNSITESSKLLASSQGMLMRHLPQLDDEGFKATSARLLSGAMNSYVASLEVARHGFPRQYGALARMVVESLATVLALGTKPEALEQFHSGNLSSTKCVTWAKKTFPILPPLWVMLSKDFVHIGKGHATLEMPKLYKKDDEALSFIMRTMIIIAWLFRVVTELVYADENFDLLYWKRSGDGWSFEPSSEAVEWMDIHLK